MALAVTRHQYDVGTALMDESSDASSATSGAENWESAFLDFFGSQASNGDGSVIPPASSLLHGIERAAQRLLPVVDGAVASVSVTDAGYRGMVEDLARRMLEVCDAILSVELLVSGRDDVEWTELLELDATQEVWLIRVEAFPGLAHVIGTACDLWRAGILEVLERWRSDGRKVLDELFDARAAGSLDEFVGGAGDRHNEGRSVALLRFTSGFGVVYKPKDLRHAAATMRLFALVNEWGPALSIPLRRIVCRDGYGWEERVVSTPAASVTAFDTFYRRLGLLIRVLQHLGARDMWADNLLAVRDEPHFIDLECVLFAPLAHDVADRAWSLTLRAEQTVVRTAIPLAASAPGFGLHAPDVGCLSHAGDPRSEGGGGVPLGEYRPWTSEETADPWDYADAVVDGYREGHRLLLERQGELLDEAGVLSAFRDVRVRYIARTTWEYQRWLRAYVGADALSDGSTWQVLDEAVRGGSSQITRSERARAISDEEVTALRRLDIPLFTTIPGSRRLFSASGAMLPGQFPRTAWDDLLQRTRVLHEFPLDAETQVLRAAIDAARGAREIDRVQPDAVSSGSRDVARNRHRHDVLSSDEIMSALTDVADVLLRAREAPLGDGHGWLGLTWSPPHNVYDVGPAGADLSGGALGPVLFLAEFASLTGDERATEAAVSVLRDLDEQSGSPLADRLEARFESGGWPVGGVAGPGALLHVARQADAILGEDQVRAIVQRQIDRVLATMDATPFSLGLATGLAGWHLQLLAECTSEHPPDAGILAALRHSGTLLVDSLLDAASEPEPIESLDRLRTVLPAGRDGVALAISRTLERNPGAIANAAAAAQAVDRHAFATETYGGRLAALAAGRSTAIPSARSARTVHDLSTMSTRGLMARGDVWHLAVQLRNDEVHAVQCRRILRVILDRRRATGRWFPDRLVDDELNLSALNGVPALGRALLRHLDPSVPALSVFD